MSTTIRRQAQEGQVGHAVAGRDEVMVFTKAVFQPFGSGLDAAGIRKGAEASLRRLRREVIDLYQLHLPDPQIPLEESWVAMTRLVEEVSWLLPSSAHFRQVAFEPAAHRLLIFAHNGGDLWRN